MSNFAWYFNGQQPTTICLPVDPPDDAADKVISFMQQERVFCGSLDQEAAASLISSQMRFVTHWFYKIRFNKKYKIPHSRSITKDYYDSAVMLVALYNLCVEWHSYPECYDLAKNYPTGLHWFLQVVSEVQDDFFNGVLDPGSSKSAALNHWQSVRKKLLDNQNPYGENSPDFSHQTHTWRLMEAVLRVKKLGYKPDSIRKFWSGRSSKTRKELRASFSERPYLQAIGELCQHLKSSNTVSVHISQGALKQRIQGGGEIHVCTIPQKCEV